jgi:formate dehydrogenase iron-sulfur subunit
VTDLKTPPTFVKFQCMHCHDPACVSACIVGALTKQTSGPVIYDVRKCIGCRYCMIACPFQVPAYEYYNPLTPEVRKCNFCFQDIKEGKLPACVQNVPSWPRLALPLKGLFRRILPRHSMRHKEVSGGPWGR